MRGIAGEEKEIERDWRGQPTATWTARKEKTYTELHSSIKEKRAPGAGNELVMVETGKLHA